MHEQPIGFVVLDKVLQSDELEQCKQEVQAMMDAYDGALPFPEYAEQYMRVHPSRWDYHALAQFVMPPNDPRNREPAPKHDSELSPLTGSIIACLLRGYRKGFGVNLTELEEWAHSEEEWLRTLQELYDLSDGTEEVLELQRQAKEQERG